MFTNGHTIRKKKEAPLQFWKEMLVLEQTKHLFQMNEINHNMEHRFTEKCEVLHANTERLKNSTVPYIQRLMNKKQGKKRTWSQVPCFWHDRVCSSLVDSRFRESSHHADQRNIQVQFYHGCSGRAAVQEQSLHQHSRGCSRAACHNKLIVSLKYPNQSFRLQALRILGCAQCTVGYDLVAILVQ